MTKPSPVRLYCEAVFVAGCLCLAWVASASGFGFVTRRPVTFAVLAAGVMLVELLPIKVPRGRQDEELTLSSSFALALLLIGGLGPALLAQGAASMVQDVSSHKPLWRARFNAAQYTVSLAAADAVIHGLAGDLYTAGSHVVASDQVPAMMLGVGTFFLVNMALVGVAIALHQRVPIRRYFFSDLGFQAITGGVMVLASPVVLATTAYSVALVPLCLAPVLGIYKAVSRGARSEHAARHDELTGLPNRAGFHHAATPAIVQGRTAGSVLLMDLDRFKEVNDTLGHHYGDLLLTHVAKRLRDAAGPEATVARLGGDEFAVLSTAGDPDQARALAKQLADSLCDPFALGSMVVDVQASVGIALFPEHGAGIDTLLQKADVAMYRAKETHTVAMLYDERHDHNSPHKLALTAALRTAVTREEIVVFYQPVLDLRTGTVTAVEALARWAHPELGILAPNAFIHTAERTNLIRPLTDRVIAVTLEQLGRWRKAGFELSAAVNISPHVLSDQSFTASVLEALTRSGIPAEGLKLEVTEGALMADPATARDVLGELQGHGVEIAIDDFGTGYSSLSYLADLPVSEVKIDRSFVSTMIGGSSERIIVTSTIDLAHHLGLRAVAEGVCDLELVSTLRQLGCDAAQGYAISPPLAGEDFGRWLAGYEAQHPQPADHRQQPVSHPQPPAAPAPHPPLTVVEAA